MKSFFFADDTDFAVFRKVAFVDFVFVCNKSVRRRKYLHSYESFADYAGFRNNPSKKIVKADISLLTESFLCQAADVVDFALANHIPGDISEFGVYKGGASIMMASMLFWLDSNTTRVVHMFDSFAGHPD